MPYYLLKAIQEVEHYLRAFPTIHQVLDSILFWPEKAWPKNYCNVVRTHFIVLFVDGYTLQKESNHKKESFSMEGIHLANQVSHQRYLFFLILCSHINHQVIYGIVEKRNI